MEEQAKYITKHGYTREYAELLKNKTMRNLLWLDDKRNPYINEDGKLPTDETYIINWVVNFDQFKKWIEMYGLPHAISFDHDLAEEHYTPEFFWNDYEQSKKYQEWKEKSYKEKTGADCAKWLVEYCKEKKQPLPTTYIHSTNPVGVDKIWSILGWENIGNGIKHNIEQDKWMIPPIHCGSPPSTERLESLGLVVNKNMSKEEFKKGYEYWLEKLFGTKIRLVDRTKETDNYMRKYKQAHPIKEEDAIDLEETFEITPNLRYVEKLIPIDDKIGKRELRLQQMWQGSDGTQKWEWIEISR